MAAFAHPRARRIPGERWVIHSLRILVPVALGIALQIRIRGRRGVVVLRGNPSWAGRGLRRPRLGRPNTEERQKPNDSKSSKHECLGTHESPMLHHKRRTPGRQPTNYATKQVEVSGDSKASASIDRGPLQQAKRQTICALSNGGYRVRSIAVHWNPLLFCSVPLSSFLGSRSRHEEEKHSAA